MVDVSKAYCPDCGSPMDEEQKRAGSSEYDSLMKTQQISKTTQFKLSEYFNQSSGSVQPQSDNGKLNEVENERKSVVVNLQPIAPVSEIISTQSGSEVNRNADVKAYVNENSKPNKIIYIVIGSIILILFLALVLLGILGFLYWK